MNFTNGSQTEITVYAQSPKFRIIPANTHLPISNFVLVSRAEKPTDFSTNQGGRSNTPSPDATSSLITASLTQSSSFSTMRSVRIQVTSAQSFPASSATVTKQSSEAAPEEVRGDGLSTRARIAIAIAAALASISCIGLIGATLFRRTISCCQNRQRIHRC